MSKSAMFLKGTMMAVVATVMLTQFPKAQAQADYQVGAQVCQYMNINQARFLEYRSEGVLNTNTAAQWIVCPIGAESVNDNVDSAARIANMSNVGAEAQCLWKLTNPAGVTIFNRSLKLFIPAGEWGILGISNIDYQFGFTLTISCKLPPQFMAISLNVEN